MALETSVILFKPDAIEKNLTGKVLARFQEAGFAIRGIKMMQLDEAILREHYAHIVHIPIFPDILAFMSRTPVNPLFPFLYRLLRVFSVAGEKAIS
ncbi:MAG: nucleoside-diphosphate kinase [Verrucomicrobiota bacterium]